MQYPPYRLPLSAAARSGIETSAENGGRGAAGPLPAGPAPKVYKKRGLLIKVISIPPCKEPKQAS